MVRFYDIRWSVAASKKGSLPIAVAVVARRMVRAAASRASPQCVESKRSSSNAQSAERASSMGDGRQHLTSTTTRCATTVSAMGGCSRGFVGWATSVYRGAYHTLFHIYRECEELGLEASYLRSREHSSCSTRVIARQQGLGRHVSNRDECRLAEIFFMGPPGLDSGLRQSALDGWWISRFDFNLALGAGAITQPGETRGITGSAGLA